MTLGAGPKGLLSQPPDARVALVPRLLQAAAAVIRPLYRSGFAVDAKSDRSPVTAADREAEAAMRALLAVRFPDDAILGEEHGASGAAGAGADWVWVLDPIDGTVSFVFGTPLFGTLVALCRRDPDAPGGLRPVLGAIHQPITGETLVGDGERALLDGRPVRVRPCAHLDDAWLLATNLYASEAHHGPERWRRLAGRVRAARGFGDCMGYLLLACGHADIMVDAPMQPWDYLPLIPIVEGAGGRITNERGERVGEGAAVIATGGGPLHEAVLEALQGA